MDKTKILIVEDEEILSRSLVEKFTQEDFAVFSAKNGEAAITIALREKPSIILLDIMLPKKDGMAVLAEIRQSGDWGKKVPVIMLTNLGIDDKILEGLVKDKPTYYLIKTEWSLNKVVEKVRETLKPM